MRLLSHIHTHIHTCMGKYASTSQSQTLTPTQTTHMLLYSGGRLIEGYNWGAGDERLSTETCACVHYSPSLLALTSPLLISPLFLSLSLSLLFSHCLFSSFLSPLLSVFIRSPVKMCSHADTYNLINSTHQLYCSSHSLSPSSTSLSICKHFL